LRSNVEEVQTNYEVKNTGKDAASFFYVTIPASRMDRLSILQAFKGVKGSAPPKEQLAVDTVALLSGAPTGTGCFKVALPASLAAGSSVKVTVITSFTRTLVPFPAAIGQADKQLVLYTGSQYELSPYTVTTQTGSFKLASSTVESHSKPGGLNGDVVTYGPFKDQEPYQSKEITIHFLNNSPFATFVSAVREIEISHWGNIAVEERYILEHTGAKLKTGFSRWDYQRNPARPGADPSFRQINAILPAQSRDVYYRDEIGNVSTSHVRDTPEGVLLELEPRFPMFGGWKTDFYIGYNVPSQQGLAISSDTGHYVLTMPFGVPFPVSVDNLEVRVILPEGSENILWSTPFDVDSVTWDKRLTYLDTFGRPVLVLKKSNVCRLNNQPFHVQYTFSSTALWREPGLLILAFLCFFLVSAVYMRIDLRIGGKDHASKSLDERKSAKKNL